MRYSFTFVIGSRGHLIGGLDCCRACEKIQQPHGQRGSWRHIPRASCKLRAVVRETTVGGWNLNRPCQPFRAAPTLLSGSESMEVHGLRDLQDTSLTTFWAVLGHFSACRCSLIFPRFEPKGRS